MLLIVLVAQTVKNLPAMQETQVQSLFQEDPLEKGMATPVFLPGKSHGQRSLVGYSPWCPKESDTTEQLNNNNKKEAKTQLRLFCQMEKVQSHWVASITHHKRKP